MICVVGVLQGLVSGARRLYPNLMRTLFHFPLDPNCRIIRLMLGEKRLDFRSAAPTMATPDAPVMEIPTFEDENGAQMPYMMVIAEYLDETYPNPPLIGRDIIERAEARRLTHYFAVDMGGRVTKPILFEKVQKPMARLGVPDSTAMRTAVQLSSQYLGLIEELYENRNWIAGGSYSLADIAAVAQISVLDYVDLIEWDRYPVLRRWYARVKSRRAMEAILADRIDGVPPPSHYANVDF